MPRVSVVITARNAESYITKAIDSVLAQSYRDLEVIVVDGGSTDGTLELVRRYGSPVRLIGGLSLTKSAGRNAGIRTASGEFVALVDADDWWVPTKLERQIQYFDRSPSSQWVYSDCFVQREGAAAVASRWSTGNQLYAGSVLDKLIFNCFVPSPTPMIRREVFETVGLYDESFARHEPEDWDLWLRIAARFPVGFIDAPLAYLRVHGKSLTAKEDIRLTADGVLSVLTRTLERQPSLSGALSSAARAHWYRVFGRRFLKIGRGRDAREFFARMVKQEPFRIRGYAWWMSTWLLQPGWGIIQRRCRPLPNK